MAIRIGDLQRKFKMSLNRQYVMTLNQAAMTYQLTEMKEEGSDFKGQSLFSYQKLQKTGHRRKGKGLKKKA